MTTPRPRGTRCTSPRCSTGSSRTCAATAAMTCSTSPPSNRSAASRRTCTWRSAAPSPAANCARSSPPPTTRCGGPPRATVRFDGDRLPVWDEANATYLDPETGEVLPTWDQALDAISDQDEPLHVARFGTRFDAQGVLAGSRDANRCIGYLTKYLTKQLGDCHELGTDAQASARRAARRGAALGTLLTGLRELAPLRDPAEERQEGPAARGVQGQGAPPRIPRLRRPPRADLPQMVRQDAGRPPRRPEGLADRDARSSGNRPGPVHLAAGRARRPGPHARRATAAARRRRPDALAPGPRPGPPTSPRTASDDLSATGRAA